MLTQEQFVRRYQDDLCGMVAQGHVSQAKDGELSLRLRLMFRKIDAMLKQMYLELTGEKEHK